MSELDRRHHHDVHPASGAVDRAGPAPGKQTLTAQLPAGDPPVQRAPVQREIAQRAEAAGSIDDAGVHAAADRGTSGHAGPLPHLSSIQRLFGGHDVSRVQAHTDAAAHEGASAMGAEAFARGDHVAFAGAPSLHTAAHEAAHVVQQRSGVSLKGGVGQAGDPHEQHADAVADAVVRGESAEALLGQYAAPGAAPGGAVQRVIRNNATGRRITRFDRGALSREDAEFLNRQIRELRVWSADAEDLARIDAALAGPAPAEARPAEAPRNLKRLREEAAVEPEGPAHGDEGPAHGDAGPAVYDEGAITPALGTWLDGDKRDTSYADDAAVHSIDKGDKTDLACWNWALRGLQDAGGPSPGDFWEYVLDPSQGKAMPPAIAAIPAVVRAELTGLTQRLAAARLARRPADLPRDHNARQQAAAAPIMQDMCAALVAANGFTVVGPEAAAATVVCQYIAREGAAVPEHWWIELPGGIVIQTVNGRPLEVGGEDTKWHSVGGRDPEAAAAYREVRVPVRALKGEHIAILEAAMAASGRRVRRRGGAGPSGR